MRSSNRPLITVSCSLCGRSEEKLIIIQNSYRMVECQNCGFIYVNPQPDQDTLNDLYQTYHAKGGQNINDWSVLMRGVFQETIHIIKQHYSRPVKLLDVGCGYGHFLKVAQKCGWEVFGLDPSISCVAYSQKQGLDVRYGQLGQIQFEEPFDVVTMHYVLEHFRNPKEALSCVNKMLKPGGLLVLRVPHTTPLVRVLSLLGIKNNLYDLPFHLSDFSPGTLKLMLSKTGFATIKTFPGKPTVPQKFLERLISLFFGNFANILYKISGNTILFPGVSKTTIAKKSELAKEEQ